MRKSILAAAAAAAITAGLLLGPAALASSSGRSTTIHVTAHFVHASLEDTAPSGPSAGDRQLVVGALTQGGSKVGRFGFECDLLNGGQNAVEECSATGRLWGGSITLEGASTLSSDTHRWAVVGGTGIYRDATGQARIHDVNQSTSDVTIELG
jgi:hypothetical protein